MLTELVKLTGGTGEAHSLVRKSSQLLSLQLYCISFLQELVKLTDAKHKNKISILNDVNGI